MSATPRRRLARFPKQCCHFSSRAQMTGLYRRYRQPQSPSDFRKAEVFEIPQVDDEPISFRQRGECSAHPGNGLAPLIFDQRRAAFIGDWELSQCGKVERQEPRRSPFSQPLVGLIETNSNQPCPKTGFKPKLLQMGECFKCGLLDNILDVRATAGCCPECTHQRREVRRDQISEEFSPPGEDLANQFDFLGGHR